MVKQLLITLGAVFLAVIATALPIIQITGYDGHPAGGGTFTSFRISQLTVGSNFSINSYPDLAVIQSNFVPFVVFEATNDTMDFSFTNHLAGWQINAFFWVGLWGPTIPGNEPTYLFMKPGTNRVWHNPILNQQ